MNCSMTRLPPHKLLPPESRQNKNQIEEAKPYRIPPKKYKVVQSTISVQASSTELDDTGNQHKPNDIVQPRPSSKISTKNVKPKVDTWRKPNFKHIEKKVDATRNGTCNVNKTNHPMANITIMLANKLKNSSPTRSEKKNGNRQKTERMLEEVNSLLLISEKSRELKMSKSYLRSVQKALKRSLDDNFASPENHLNEAHQNDILKRLHEPIRKGITLVNSNKNFEKAEIDNFETINRNMTIDNINITTPNYENMEASFNFEIKEQRSSKERETKKNGVCISSSLEKEVLVSKKFTCDVRHKNKEELNPEDENTKPKIKPNEDENPQNRCESNGQSSKVRTLMSFWNEKFVSRPVTQASVQGWPKEQTKNNEGKLSKVIVAGGVTEEHTLKPSELKDELKEASSIADAIRINKKIKKQKNRQTKGCNTITNNDILEAKKVKDKVIYTMSKLEQLLNNFPEERNKLCPADVIRALHAANNQGTEAENDLDFYKKLLAKCEENKHIYEAMSEDEYSEYVSRKLNEINRSKWMAHYLHGTIGYNDDSSSLYSSVDEECHNKKRTVVKVLPVWKTAENVHFVQKIHFINVCYPYSYKVKQMQAQRFEFTINQPTLTQVGVFKTDPCCNYSNDPFFYSVAVEYNNSSLSSPYRTISADADKIYKETDGNIYHEYLKDNLDALTSTELEQLCLLGNHMLRMRKQTKGKSESELYENIMKHLKFVYNCLKTLCQQYLINCNEWNFPQMATDAMQKNLMGIIAFIESDRVYFTVVIAIFSMLILLIISL